MKYFISGLLLLFASCASFAINDPHTILDPVSHTLRGATPANDRPESDCDPVKGPDGSLQYQCVVHKFPDYQALLISISSLQNQLKACQAK